jgi:hypothetical protein
VWVVLCGDVVLAVETVLGVRRPVVKW